MKKCKTMAEKQSLKTLRDHVTSALAPSLCFLVLLHALFLAGPTAAFAGETIRINGSGSGLAMMKPLMEAYGKGSRNVSFEMEKPLGSSGAIKALLAGALDIVVTSKPLEPDAIARGGKIRYFGKTPLAIVTQTNNPIKTISTKELEDIYAGRATKWPDGQSVRLVLRPLEDVDTKILKGLSPGIADMVTKAPQRRGMITAVTDPESNDMVSRTVGAIGASGLTGVPGSKAPLKVIALNGVMPSPEALADGSYPLGKRIDFVTTDKLPPAAAKFLDFIYSSKGRAIAKKTGVLVTADADGK